MARKAVSKKVRFEVFKRDAFTCQYCGNSAPTVVLQVDHIHPVAKGGLNDILNLATSCFDCNSGKKDRLLSDAAVVTKQMNQAKILSERKEQIGMIASWRQSLVDLLSQEVENLAAHLSENYRVRLNELGKAEIKLVIKKYGFASVLEAVDISADTYLRNVEDVEERRNFFQKIPGICYWRKREKENPVEGQVRKLAYLANKSWYSCVPRTLVHRLLELHKRHRIPLEDLRALILASTGIMRFEEAVENYFTETSC